MSNQVFPTNPQGPVGQSPVGQSPNGQSPVGQAGNPNNAWAYFQQTQNGNPQQANPNNQQRVQYNVANQNPNFVNNPNMQQARPQQFQQGPGVQMQYPWQVPMGQAPNGQPWYYNPAYGMPNMQQQMYNQNRQVVKPVVKKWSSVSMKWFLIWCSVFLLFVIWWGSLFMYYLMNNPDQLANMWLDRTTTKKLLQAFSWVFFWLLFLVGFGMTIVNAYRIISVKNKPKTWYALWIFLWLLIFAASIWFGYTVITKISSIETNETLSNNEFVVPYMNFKWIKKDQISDPSVKFVAPGNVSFYFNSKLFNSQIYPTLWQVTINEVTLNCGNWQTIPLNMKNWTFDWDCIYFKKWNYPLKVDVYYANNQTNEKLQNSFDAWSVNMESEIAITLHGQDITYNDAKTEMILGKIPAKVTFDASSIFKDFNLTDYKILWDADDDGKPEKQDTTTFTYTYKNAKLHYLSIRFPDLNNYTYTFPLRVEQSDVPICDISGAIVQWTEYAIASSFMDNNTTISDYSFSIVDKAGKVIDTKESSDWTLRYTFPWKWTYSVRLLFLTNEWKKGQCESDDIQVAASEYDIIYDMFYKSPTSPEFKKIQNDKLVFLSWSDIIVSELPVVLQANIVKVTPDSNSLNKKLLVDWKAILSSDDRKFEFTVDEDRTYIVTILVEDPTRWTKTEIPVKVIVDRADIIGNLLVKPGNVGQDPFSVTLDASTTVLNDPTDEIVYFTWDFDDGEIQKNLSQWIVKHTYKYDTAKDNWEYTPKVTIRTKKQREIVVSLPNPLIIKKSTEKATITSESHPSQVAKIWDTINLALQIDWLPNTIVRDFGDGTNFECKNRECIEVEKTFQEAWFFVITAKIRYEGKPEVQWTIKFKVQ